MISKKKTLDMTDVYELLSECEPMRLMEKLGNNWFDGLRLLSDERSVFRTTIRTLWCRLLLICFLCSLKVSQFTFLRK